MTINQTRQLLDELYLKYTKEFEKEDIVLGEGCIDSPLIVIGEAPGKDEVKHGKPFVGAAGKNLNEFISMLEIDRKDIFITNAIKYRLGKLNPNTKRIVNRAATMQDVRDNQKWIYDEIKLLQPHIIVTLGNVPLRAVTDNSKITIGDVHGVIQTCEILQSQYRLFPLYHPASIIYNRKLKEVYIQDILNLKKILSDN
jgi:DNA polymerase